jgi:hypothetical protein
MKNKALLLKILTVALTLGTAWAVRGKFGHEQGAAWAGAIGTLAVILVAGREDWYRKVFKILAVAAIGWGISGVMSYGLVVGYGKSTDFSNAFYGLAMLFLIGSLYGFIGGGHFGLALADGKSRVTWSSLLAEMVALALVTYGFLINQLEWLMTPPRSEMWAACLGVALALAWYLIRNKEAASLRVAVYTGLGAGFGFAFGNFLQVVGTGSDIPISLWNVMEYSIGFFGGAGMAYGVFTSAWPEATESPSRAANFFFIGVLVVFIPFIVWDQSFVTDRLAFLLEEGGTDTTVTLFQTLALTAIVLFAIVTFVTFRGSRFDFGIIRNWFFGFLGLYTLLSFALTGLYRHPVEQYLYLVNMVVIAVLFRRREQVFVPRSNRGLIWLAALCVVVAVIAVLALVAISSHGELRGSQTRFQ